MLVLPSTFLSWLLGAMEGASEHADKRHIIRFDSVQEFRACSRLLRQRRKSLPQLRRVQPLPLIQGMACTLRIPAKPAAFPFIRSIEANIRMKVHRLSKKTASLQQGVPTLGEEQTVIPWGIKHIRAPEVWSKSQGERIHIGVVDTGADYSHPNLRHCLAGGFNVLNRQLLPIDDNGHGTHIAGTIAGYTRGGGIIGVAPQAYIHPVKAFDHQGSAYVSDIISGIEWCVRNGMDIINMSFGMKTYSKALEAAVKNAYQAGVIIVASSGNDGRKTEVDYPARLSQVIAVGATNRKGQVASFSNIGRQIDIYAPGEKIYSTWLRGRYHVLSGTSMATSHVTGVIALLLAKQPGMRPRQIKALLKRHGRMILKPGKVGSAREIHAVRVVSAAAAGD
jgi:subtilisin